MPGLTLRIPWSTGQKLPLHLSPSQAAGSPLQEILPPRLYESSADSPGSRLSQGKALAPGEPEGGGGGKEVGKVEAESELGRRRGARWGGVERGVPAAIGQ